MQPNQFTGDNVVVEVRGPGALAYCGGLGARWHAAPPPTFITSACTLSRPDVGIAIVWDTGLHVDGNETCDSLRSTDGWVGG